MTRKKAVQAAAAVTLSGGTIGDAQALGDQKTKAVATQVADLLSQALKLAQEHDSVGWVTAWLDDRDELEGYGYTVELKEQIEGLEEEKADLLAVYPKGFPLDLSIVEQLQVEEFFRHLRDPAHRPAAGERLEALLQRCRGFKVEQLEQVLQWLDSYGLGELPFGPTDELRDQVRELERKLEQTTDMVRILTQAAQSAPMDDDTEEKALFLITHWEQLPVDALRWVVRHQNQAQAVRWETETQARLERLADALEGVLEVEALRSQGKEFPARILLPQAAARAADALEAVGRLQRVARTVARAEDCRILSEEDGVLGVTNRLALRVQTLEEQEKLAFLVERWDSLPLAALQWIVEQETAT